MKTANRSRFSWMALGLAVAIAGCESLDMRPNDNNPNVNTIDVAQASGQLASGLTFNFGGSSTEFAGLSGIGGRSAHGGGPAGNKHDRHNGILDGFSLLAPTDELLAMVEAESAGDLRGMRMSKIGGAKITHYDANGKIVVLPLPEDGPHGHSFSGKDNPELDSLLSLIVKTEIDFGAGVTFTRDTVSITRKGMIRINRNVTQSVKTEVVTYIDYSVNDFKIEGTKTRTSTFDATTGNGESNTKVTDGKITLKDGTVTTWTSEKKKVFVFKFGQESKKPVSGTITTTVDTKIAKSDGSVVYLHRTNQPLVEKIECRAVRRRGPVSGEMETQYRADNVKVNYGDGSCENKTVTITINGVVSTKTIR
ncbi:MAG: hypothetical protein FJZ78_10905 [Bacteroidetes bacterium]|nr:hypothetical protein [Bacteroidota bacterium]